MGVAQDKLDAIGIDAICERISGGETLTHLSQDIGVGVARLITWLGTPERSARANEARRLAAQVWDEMAEGTLLSASPEDISVARELAHHYRWRASKMAPRTYGDRHEVEHSGKVEMTLESIVAGVPTPQKPSV
jgi:hypothetical protein